MLHNIETSQLHTIRAVTSAGSFSKAAEELGVTQSAISQSIKNIETKLGVQLFRRAGKQVFLTPEGEKLDDLARNYFKQLENTLEAIQVGKDQMAGPLRLGTLTGVGKSWLAPTVLDFVQEYPNIQMDLKLGFQEDLVESFEQGQIDILVLPEEHLPKSGEKILLGEELLTLVAPKSEEYNLQENLTLEDLGNFPMILFEKNDRLFFKWCSHFFGKVPPEINCKFVINSHGHILQAVRRGIGVAVLPIHVVKRSIFQESLQTFGSTFSNGKFYLVYHKGAHKIKRIDQILEYLSSANNPLKADS